jgi:hypothetical protein
LVPFDDSFSDAKVGIGILLRMFWQSQAWLEDLLQKYVMSDALVNLHGGDEKTWKPLSNGTSLYSAHLLLIDVGY